MKMTHRMALTLNAEAYQRRLPVPAFEAATATELFENPGFQTLQAGAFKTSFCLAQTQPGVAAAILATDPGSKEEQSAFASAIPSIVNCTDTGAKLALNKSVFRLSLAFHYYRLSRLQIDAPAGKN